MRPEAKFQYELKKAFEYFYKCMFWLKIPDMPLGKEDRELLPEHMRFMPGAPFDCVAVIGGVPFAFEFKVTDNDKILLSRLSEKQEGNLWKFKHAGGASFIVVRVNGANGNLCSFVSIEEWTRVKVSLLKHNIKSIYPLDFLEGVTVRDKIMGKTHWDVFKVINKYIPKKFRVTINQQELRIDEKVHQKGRD